MTESVVYVPCFVVMMCEQNGVRERIVVVDYIRKVCHAFVALVLRRVELGCGIVDRVDSMLPTNLGSVNCATIKSGACLLGKFLLHPTSIMR